MTFSLNVDGVQPLLLEDGITDLMTEDGANILTLEGLSDVSATALLYGAITQKFNTMDFGMIDLAAPALGATVTTTDPAWSGTVAATVSSNPVDLINGHQVVVVTVTNTKALPADTAPFDLSDTPVAATSGDYLLEDGSGHYLIESGTDFAPGALLLEQALSYGYAGLTVRKMNTTPATTLAICTVEQSGLRPGNTVHLTSQNQGYAAYALQINQATITWAKGANPPKPTYLIEMGDTPQTLAQWTQVTAPAAPPPLVAPTVIPLGPVIFGQCGVGLGHGQNAQLYAAGGGIVTVASATFSVSAPIGHTLTCQVQSQVDALAYAWSNFVATPRRALRATISGGIYTGSWIELPGGWTGGTTAGFRTIVDLSSGLGIALAAGTYTVTIDIDTQGTNQIEIFSGWANVAVTTV